MFNHLKNDDMPAQVKKMLIFPDLISYLVFTATTLGLFYAAIGLSVVTDSRPKLAKLLTSIAYLSSSIWAPISILELAYFMLTGDGGYNSDCPPQAQRYCL